VDSRKSGREKNSFRLGILGIRIPTGGGILAPVMHEMTSRAVGIVDGSPRRHGASRSLSRLCGALRRPSLSPGILAAIWMDRVWI